MSRSSDPHDPLSRLTANLAGHLEHALEGAEAAEGDELCFALFVFDGKRMFHAANVEDADLQAALAEYLAARAN